MKTGAKTGFLKSRWAEKQARTGFLKVGRDVYSDLTL
jgi:hypothetical protein